MHLKRFQFVNHRWIKSHKAVQFPYTDLDLTSYLAAIPCETLLRHQELKNATAAATAAVLADSLEGTWLQPLNSLQFHQIISFNSTKHLGLMDYFNAYFEIYSYHEINKQFAVVNYFSI